MGKDINKDNMNAFLGQIASDIGVNLNEIIDFELNAPRHPRQ